MILCARRESVDEAMKELRAFDKNARIRKFLTPEICVIESQIGFEDLISSLNSNRVSSIFIRHFFPLELETLPSSEEADAIVRKIAKCERRYNKDEGMVSRSEFKLREAFDVFKIKPPDSEAPSALDLGASPGGWSRVLLSKGFSVTAADPAPCDSRLSAHPNFTQLQTHAQRLPDGLGPFDLVANDMRMDMFDSCRVTLDAARFLKRGGESIMTFKLPHSHKLSATRNALKLLEQKFEILSAKQLFHNRDEVTVYMRLIID